jgi:hypothetical protein
MRICLTASLLLVLAAALPALAAQRMVLIEDFTNIG